MILRVYTVMAGVWWKFGVFLGGFKYSFFPRTIPVWNSLLASVAEAPDLALFKQGLTSLSF